MKTYEQKQIFTNKNLSMLMILMNLKRPMLKTGLRNEKKNDER